MKRAFTVLLTAACLCVAAPVFAQGASPFPNSIGDTKTDSAPLTNATESSATTTTTTTKESETKSVKSTKTPRAAKEPKVKKNGSAAKPADAVKTDATAGDAKTAKSKAPAKGNLATRTASFFTGSFFGTPIAIAREIGGETKIATKDIVGETNNWFLIAPALPLGLIGGILSGTPQGFMFGVKNAFEGSLDAPFSKEAFSLDDELE